MMRQISNPDDEKFMRMALELADRAARLGEVPVGAVLVENGRVISSGFNLRESANDPTAHAEMQAIREASTQLKRWRLFNTTLYVTLEPCPMCAGALVQARIPRVVFGCFDPKAGACGSLMNILQDSRMNHRVEIESRCLEEACGDMLKRFFTGLRVTRGSNLIKTVL